MEPSRWGALGLGRRGITPPKRDLEDLEELFGPSLLDRMVQQDRLSRERLGRGEYGPPPIDSPEFELAADVAGNLDFTGALGGSVRNALGGEVLRDLGEMSGPSMTGGGLMTETPFFDLTDLSQLPDVPQRALPRMRPPPKAGIPENIKRVADPANIARVNRQVEEGLKFGGGVEWYNTLPLREKFIEELGEEAGNSAWHTFFDMVGATSPQSKVPENIRNASYYFTRMMSGQDIPSVADMKAYSVASKAAKSIDPKAKVVNPLPEPYGHFTQTNQVERMYDILAGKGLNPIKNPKISSFAENLRGNYEPLTVDMHNLSMLGVLDPKGQPLKAPEAGHYSFLEDLQKAEASKMGLKPAQYQAAGWLMEPGVRSELKPFMQIFDDVLTRTAKKRGVSKAQAFRDLARGKAPLLGLGPLGTMLTTMMSEHAQDGLDDENGA